MPRRDWRVRARDIVEAAARAQSYVRDLAIEQFKADRQCIDAAVLVIGEANAIPTEVATAAPEIPWADIRGMRNRIAHEYFGVDLDVLWHTVVDDLPQVQKTVSALLDRTDL